jgi:3-oxoacyl-[acyl-carrier-protein] synthase-3
MNENIYSVIAASGSYIPEKIVPNSDFLSNIFYDSDGKVIEVSNEELIQKFQKITNIVERRHLDNGYVTSDIA